jgi:hypothetical protein
MYPHSDQMNTQTLLERLEALRDTLVALEADPNSSDDAWEAVLRELETLEELLWLEKTNQMEDERDTQEDDAMVGWCGFRCNFGCPSCQSYDPSDEI